MAIDARCLFPMPDTMSYEEGALLEPLSVGIWGCNKAQLVPGDDVLVTGAGPVGLLAAATARAFGAKSVTITDVSDIRLGVAADLGFETQRADADPVPAGTYDVLLECSGAPGALGPGLERLRTAGRAAMIGMPKQDVVLPLARLNPQELNISTVNRYAHTWPIALKLVASGRIDVRAARDPSLPAERDRRGADPVEVRAGLDQGRHPPAEVNKEPIMQLGCHGSVWTGSFDRSGMTTAVAGTAKAGFDLIEIPLMEPDAIDVDHTRSLLQEHGLACDRIPRPDAGTRHLERRCRHRRRRREAPRPCPRGPRRARWHSPGRCPLLRHAQVHGPPHSDGSRAQPGRHRQARWSRAGTRHHGRHRGGQPVRDEPAEHRPSSPRLPRRVRQEERRHGPGPPGHLPHEHRGARHGQPGPRRRRAPGVRPHRREQPRLCGLWHSRFRHILQGAPPHRLRRARRLRVLLVGDRPSRAEQDARCLAQPLGGRRGPRRPRTSSIRNHARGTVGRP